MKKPLIAIVGRPNVGKSTFFNKIAGKKISIVKDEPGVTRDRIYADAEWLGNAFSIVDTGGLNFKNQDDTAKNILNQAQIAIELADTILFFVDGKEGLTSDDKEVAIYLRKSKKPILLVVNKLDNFDVSAAYEFYELALGEPIAISAEQSKGLGELLDKILETFPNKVSVEEVEDCVKIAIVGRPNAGKSSITNRLLGEDRVVVSPVAGTTRDAIDTPFKYYGKNYTIIDTAGMRRKSKIDDDSIEQYSVLRALEAVRRADVVVVVLDANEGISEQDVRILGYVHEQGKPNIVVMNKWDLIEKDEKTMNEYLDKLKVDLSFMSYFQPLFISTITGQRFAQIMPLVDKVLENSGRRVKTSTLNEIIGDAVRVTPPPSKAGKPLKILFATQVATKPPTFVIFVNDEKLVHFSYERYLENSLRRALPLEGTPINIIFRNRKNDEIGA
ncbi:MAG: ribosome biogenesis GTPase Der [Tenericutes bacterium HGW-Tenericutes-4]|nr:MAG: ribosome biogenesis GTPase Der [Tenericutes bacterium HGW-Tenericutes-4]